MDGDASGETPGEAHPDAGNPSFDLSPKVPY
jgi:hypothetical protein